MTALFCSLCTLITLWLGWELNNIYHEIKCAREIEKFHQAAKRKERILNAVAKEFGLPRKKRSHGWMEYTGQKSKK